MMTNEQLDGYFDSTEQRLGYLASENYKLKKENEQLKKDHEGYNDDVKCLKYNLREAGKEIKMLKSKLYVSELNSSSQIEQKENEIYQEIINAKHGVTPEKFGTVEAILIRRLATLECMITADTSLED
jgi:predicted  nucleic acid-binding Zn-ribbon protein